MQHLVFQAVAQFLAGLLHREARNPLELAPDVLEPCGEFGPLGIQSALAVRDRPMPLLQFLTETLQTGSLFARPGTPIADLPFAGLELSPLLRRRALELGAQREELLFRRKFHFAPLGGALALGLFDEAVRLAARLRSQPQRTTPTDKAPKQPGCNKE